MQFDKESGIGKRQTAALACTAARPYPSNSANSIRSKAWLAHAVLQGMANVIRVGDARGDDQRAVLAVGGMLLPEREGNARPRQQVADLSDGGAVRRLGETYRM